MNFDRLARHYDVMETLLAGQKLQRCRTSLLNHVAECRRVLLAGEGHGRFLLECLSRLPDSHATCVERSPRMIGVAQRRLQSHASFGDRVRWVNTDLLAWHPGGERFDLIVTQFFLDCFPPPALTQVVARLTAAAEPNARWLLADFHQPDRGWAGWRAAGILKLMYASFRIAVKLPAVRLTPPDEDLRRQGWILRERRLSEWALLHSDLWVRDLASSES